MGRAHLEKEAKRRSLRNLSTTVIIAFAIVAFWRGVWGLMDLYFFPGAPKLSFIYSILIGIIILFLTKHLMSDLI